jgi:hypothetical protein
VTEALAHIDHALSVSASYAGMLDRIERRLPDTRRGAEPFNKSASQFKTATLDVTDLTPIATARHLLASITRTRQALEEASVSVRRKRVDLKEAEHKAMTLTGFDAERADIDAAEARLQIENIEASARGAIRKIAFLIGQYDAILASLGVDAITEEMYEEDQARHHVMTAFAQALHAARARSGTIDEGNLIYLFQLGINGRVAQAEIAALLKAESQILAGGQAPTHAHTMRWLEAIGERFAPEARAFARLRGLDTMDPQALLIPEEEPAEASR